MEPGDVVIRPSSKVKIIASNVHVGNLSLIFVLYLLCVMYLCWTCAMKFAFVMAYSYCTGPGLGQVQGTGLGLMGPSIFYRNLYTGLRLGKEPGPIVSYCVGPVPCNSTVTVQCE